MFFLEKMSQTLLAFSMYNNVCTQLNSKQPSGVIACIHGIRFLSMVWVVNHHNAKSLVYSAAKSKLNDRKT